MKQYTITIPDDKNQFFLELINSLGFAIQEGGAFSVEDAQVNQWQLDIVENRIKNASDKSSKNWDDIKDNFKLD
jgi:hypothetical protein